MCRALQVSDARRIVEEMRLRGAPRGEEVQFGFVVQTPGTSNVCLAVVQPHQGRQVQSQARHKSGMLIASIHMFRDHVSYIYILYDQV